MSRTVDMTTGSTAKHILKFAFPLLLTNLGQQLYMIVDAAIVGRGVGVKALAAVGATDWSYWLILWSIMGFTQGFGTFVSRYFGDKNFKDMNKVIATSTVLCAIIGGIFTLAGVLVARPLLSLLNTPSDIIGDATTYLITMAAGSLVVTAYNMSSAILLALGDSKTPLIAMIIAGLLNVALDCLFVLAFQWGIFGAALASVLAQLVSFLFCLFRIRSEECIHLDRDAWRIDRRTVRALLVFGIPIALQFVTLDIGGILLQSSVNLQGSLFIAGYTATNKVYGLLECSAIALGLACSTFFSQNFGAGQFGRVKHGVRVSVKIAVAMAVTVLSAVLLARRPLLKLFLNVNEAGGAEALEHAVRYLVIMVVFLVILYLLPIFRNVLQAIEISVWSMISGIAECVCRVFMAKVMIHYWGSDALFISEPVAWGGALLCVLLPYVYYRKKILNRETRGKLYGQV